MNWPDIFFKAKKLRPAPEGSPDPESSEKKPPEIAPSAPLPVAATPGLVNTAEKAQPPAIRPIPAGVPPQSFPKIKIPAARNETGTRTLPAMHGVVLRLPTQALTPAMPRPAASIKNMAQLMAEADPMHPVNQSSTMRLMKRPDAQPRPSFLPPAERPARPAATLPPSAVPQTPVAADVPPTETNPAPVVAPPAGVEPEAGVTPTTGSVPITANPIAAPPAPLPAIPTAKATASVNVGSPSVSVPRATAVVPPLDAAVSGQAWPEFPRAEGSRPAPPRLVPPPQMPGAQAPATTETPPVASGESPFILKPSVNLTATPKPNPNPRQSTTAALLPFGPVAHRKARMADVARIVLPPKREDQTQSLSSSGPIPTVVPSAFPVAGMTARPSPIATPAPSASSPEKPHETLSETTNNGTSSLLEPPMIKDFPHPDALPEAAEEESDSSKPESLTATKSDEKAGPEAAPETKTETPAFPAPQSEGIAPEKPAAKDESPSGPGLVLDPEAHKPDAPDPLAPQLDPEAHKPAPPPATTPEISSTAPTPPPKDEAVVEAKPASSAAPLPMELGPSARSPERREFQLANGERVAGIVLSETPETVYVEHATLGVLTIPRAQLAKRLVEIILINGDRVVGDLMAETADTLYVRHASLGMLTVPRAQRSTRVVEAILKNGDRILGEVLSETENFTVIRSATLGTVTVQHANVAMLNRKIEQVELKALPSSSPDLKSLPGSADK